MAKIAVVTNPTAFAGPAAISGLTEQGMTIVKLARGADLKPESAIARVIEEHGHIDVLVNNDVIDDAQDPVLEGSFETLDVNDFRRVLEDLLVFPFAVARAVAPHMIRSGGGVMVFVTSANALRPHPRVSMYNAARAGATNLAASLAKELGPAGIIVNSIAPTFFSNPTYFPDGRVESDPRQQHALATDVPLRRLGTEQEMAALIGFLASGRVPPITGGTIGFSGGWHI